MIQEIVNMIKEFRQNWGMEPEVIRVTQDTYDELTKSVHSFNHKLFCLDVEIASKNEVSFRNRIAML